MEKLRDWKRPVVVLATLGALTVVALAAPASAHLGSFGHLKSHIKKIAKKVAKKEATTIVQTTVGPSLFIEEDEMVRFHFGMDVGQPDRTVGTFGPFTFKATCSQPGPGARADLLIATSEAGSVYNTRDEYVPGFGPADGFRLWLRSEGNPLGGDPYDPSWDLIGHAASPTMGLTAFTGVYNNVGGSDCVFQGAVALSPRTA